MLTPVTSERLELVSTKDTAVLNGLPPSKSTHISIPSAAFKSSMSEYNLCVGKVIENINNKIYY